MTQSRFSALLLALLALAVVAVLARSLQGDERDGFIVLYDLKAGELEHEAFEVEQAARVAIAATGSFQAEEDTAMAAAAWLVRRGDGALVWRLGPHNAERSRATLATAEETVKLDPGAYDLYFATFGADRERRSDGSFLGGLFTFANKDPWRGDASRWALTLDVLSGEARHADPDPAAWGTAVLWSTGPVEGHEREEFAFTVERPVDLRVRALGEFEGRTALDYGWIEGLTSGEKVWAMRAEDTRPAGGAARNRAFDGTVRLVPGAYRAVYVTDARHDADGWVENPPFRPYRWGMALSADRDADAVRAFDPWTDREPLVALIGVRDDALERATFTLDRPAAVWVSGTGELRSGHRYDYAWLQREGGETVWEMDYADSRPAGGEARNRTVEAALSLEPATYTLHVRTDDTHSPARWYSEGPQHPERWGAAVFALDPLVRAANVVYQRSAAGATPELPAVPAPPVPPAPPPGAVSPLPVSLQGLGNDRDEARLFELDAPTRLRVRAVGEMIRDDRYDYGWITREGGDVVWQMTRENTEPAGGAAKNRRFDGVVALPAGRYVVRFRTDGSHSFERFEQEPPTDPAAWGIAVTRE